MIVAFAGPIASGKSAVSKAVAEHYSVERVSFGDAVRTEAKRRGLGKNRTTLQDLGDELIIAGWDHFCLLVLEQAHWDGQRSLVVDGVRHEGALDALRDRADRSRLFLVFVDTSWGRRLAWLVERGVSVSDAVAADNHPNESELDAIRNRADLVVANDADLDVVVARVVRSLDAVGSMD